MKMSNRMIMSLICAFIFLVSSTLSNAARVHKNPPSAVIVGTVYCDTCFHQDFTQSSHFISGASVAVECGDKDSRPSFREVAKTDEQGEFKVHLPISVSKHLKKIKGCSVKLINSSEPYCAVASTASSSSIHLKSRKDGTHIFSSGFFTFKPLEQPELCDQLHNPTAHKPKRTMSIDDPNDPKFSPPLQDPPSSDLQPLPELPRLPALPRLPPLPPLPGIPVGGLIPGPGDEKVSSRPDFFNPLFPFPPLLTPPSIFPPITNPLQPPPSILPPVLPSPPSSIIPPIFPSPPPSIFPPIFPSPVPPTSYFPPFQFPPIPGLTPSPPPPTPPFLPNPIPPFPFQPTPGLPGPGIPPASPGVPSATTSFSLPGKSSP